MKIIKIFTFIFLFFIYLIVFRTESFAMVTPLTPYSWDPGLYATYTSSYDNVHAWGMRKTAGAWGTGPVNYQSGATISYRANSSGTLNFDMLGTYCPNGQCAYGAGTGYKGLVQFWNNPTNYIAFGLIHDPGVSPVGTTIMVEGAANGVPVGGYWPTNAITGTAHHITVTWTANGISFTLDNNVTLGVYPVTENNPSISFLAAARETGDICDTTFQNINFSPGSVNTGSVSVPTGSPYFTFQDTITANGSGSGYSAYINAHDANNNAISVGIQSDSTSPSSGGKPTFIYERVQNGVFSHQYISPASNSPTTIKLAWWSNNNMAVFYVNNTPIADISVILYPRLFFNIEGNARQNGDSVNDTFSPVSISVGNNCPTYCGLNGSWNTSSFNYFGLRATNTNGEPQNGATFTVTGTVSGLPSGGTWNTNEVAGIGMIAQYWNGQ
ncbi:hypothetical protein M1145_03100 [Patescibacteria group bacterium]|nr:hypothetical protein [Patescibacteria group bacterium]